MRAIGFRAEPDAVTYAIVDGTLSAPTLVAFQRITAPATFKEAAALAWYRERVRRVVQEYQPKRAAVRYPEPSARKGHPTSAHKRARIEGVVLEAMHAENLAIVTGPLATISARLGSESAKAYITQDDLRGLDWTKLNANAREAVLAAAAILE